MDKNKVNVLEIIESEDFERFFITEIDKIKDVRKGLMYKLGIERFKRDAYDELSDLFNKDFAEVRAEIHSVYTKTSKLSKRCRDAIIELTINASVRCITKQCKSYYGVTPGDVQATPGDVQAVSVIVDDINPRFECCVCGKTCDVNEGEPLTCTKCGEYYCDACGAEYNQFTQIDYDCCKNCSEQ